MEKYLKKIKPQHYWIVAFVLTTITYTMTFSYLGMLGNGKYIIARSDLKQQYIPFIEYFCSVLRGEHDYWFSWSLNLGTGTALLFAYYTLSPLNLIYLILGEGMELTATAIVVVLKASIAAATFQIFITRYLKKEYYETVLFAMMYALCGFQVCYYFDLMWMDAFYMLPVIALCIIRLIRENKVWGLLFAYAYVFAVNFYMGYIIGVSTCFLFLFVFCYHCKKRKISENIKILVYYGMSVIGALLLTAVIWLPAVIQLFGNMEEGYPDFSLAKCNILFLINNLFMGQMQTLNGITPFVYSGLLVLLLLPLYFFNKHITCKKRIYTIVCIVWFICLFLVEPLNEFMHAFDKPEMFGHRFSYVFSFVLITVCCEQVLYIRQLKNKTIFWNVIFFAGVFVACAVLYPSVWNDEYNTNTLLALLVNAVFISIWVFVIKQLKNRKLDLFTFRVAATFLLMVELGSSAAICMNRMEHEAARQDKYEAWNEWEGNTFSRIKERGEDDFYRTLYLSIRGQNQAFMRDYHSVENFNSSEHKEMMKALERLGFHRGVHMMKGAGSTPITRALLGIKYIVYGNQLESEIGSDEIYLAFDENTYSLALGYMVKNEAADFEFVESPFENQDNLLSLMTGKEIKCFERIGMRLNTDSGVYAKTDSETYLMHEEGQEGDSRFEFRADCDGRPLYIYFSQDRYVDKTNGAEIPSIESDEMVALPENGICPPDIVPARIVEIGVNANDEYSFSVVLPKDLEGDYYKKAFFSLYDEGEFLKAYETLKEHQWDVQEYKDGYIGGTIEAKEAGIMFTSIPYDTGWSVVVDGKEVESIPLLENAFVGVQLREGVHYIEMHFEPAGKREGMIISGVMSAVLIGIYSLCRLYKKKICTKNTKIDKKQEKM